MKARISDQLDVYHEPSINPRPVVFYIHPTNKRTCEDLLSKGCVCCSVSSGTQGEIAQTNLNTIMITVGGFMMVLSTLSYEPEQLAFSSAILVLFLVVMLAMVVAQDMPTTLPQKQQVFDTSAHFKWCYDHIHEFGGDVSRIIICGEHSGAHIGALLTTNPYFLDSVGLSASCVKAFAGINGFYSDKRLTQQRLHALFGTRETYYDMFPVYNVSNGTKPHLLVSKTKCAHVLDYHYALMTKSVFVKTVYSINFLEELYAFIQEVLH